MTMSLFAKFSTRCRVCKKVIGTGEPIGTLSDGRHVHLACKDSETCLVQFDEKPLIAPEGLSYLPYQVEGIRRMLERRSSLLGDEMGLGKTIQAIGFINQCPQLSTVCVVCPASLRYNWASELRTWLVKDPLRTFGLYPSDHDGTDLARLNVAIVSYTAVDLLPEWYEPELLILDEAHYVKNPDALRTQRLKKLARKSAAKLFLTGSPIENRVKELWTLLQMLDTETWDPAGFCNGQMVRAGEGAGWIRFAKRHCGGRLVEHFDPRKKRMAKHFVFDGSTHLDELHEKLKASVLIRRLKKDVLKDLPEKRRQMIVLPPPTVSAVLEREAEALAKTGLDYASDLNALHKASIEFQDLAKARARVGSSKAPQVAAHIENCLEQGIRPIVVMARHREVVEELSLLLRTHSLVTYTGDHSEADRNRAVKAFQGGGIDLFIGTIGAAGVGLTLTAASHGIFAEFEWKDMRQAEDRLHRVGQKNAVLWQYLVHDWSVDSNMLKLVWKKMAIAERALDGKGGT